MTVKSISYLPDGFTPSPTDVIVGRGKKVHDHEGNRLMRNIVEQRLQQYQESNKTFRSVILASILKRLHADSGTQFVKLDPSTKRWHSVSDAHARATLAQTFRDALSHQYRSSKQAKQKRRHQIQSKSGYQSNSDDEGENFPNLDSKKPRGSMSLMNAIRHTKNTGNTARLGYRGISSDVALQSSIRNVIIVPPRIESSGIPQYNFLNPALDEALASFEESDEPLDLQAAFPSREGSIDDPLLFKPFNELPLFEPQQEAEPFW